MSEASMIRRRPDAAPREAEQGWVSQLITGVIFLAVMLLLFVLSGFRG
jgi:hypothetical protein